MASRSDNLDKNTSIKNSHVLLASPEHVPWYHGVLVPGPPQIPRSTDAQVPYVKWCRAWHTVAPPHPDSQLQTENNVSWIHGCETQGYGGLI